MTVRILTGDCREVLRSLPGESVQCVVTSPPYWGLRDYGTGAAGIGLEATMQEHLAALVGVFQEVRRVLRPDGTLWLNYGDSYASNPGQATRGGPPSKSSTLEGNGHRGGGPKLATLSRVGRSGNKGNASADTLPRVASGLKPKDLMGLPWRLAFALQDDGWWLRQDIIWAKPNPMPESVTDRPTRAHEYVFLMSKSARYFYNAEAIKEPAIYFGLANQDESGFKNPRSFSGKHKDGYRSSAPKGNANGFRGGSYLGGEPGPRDTTGNVPNETGLRNSRSVWEIATEPYGEAHFATFPTRLAERCILAGTEARSEALSSRHVVLDPFGGAGTVGMVADRLQRDAILIELNPEYALMAERRIRGDASLFAEIAT